MALDTQAPFVWGAGGAQMTPEAIANKRKVAEAMMMQGMDYSPIKSPWQGAARVAQAMMGGLDYRRADTAERANVAADRDLLSSVLPGGQPMNIAPAVAAQPAAQPVAQPSISTPMGKTAIPASPETSLEIEKVAQSWGVDPKYLTRVASLESNGGLNNVNPNSSARGPFQFMPKTAQQYGLTNPMDPNASADAAARLTLDNKTTLAKVLGREPTPGELYLAHQQGAGGASKLLANPNAPVESIIGLEAARLNGATPGMTAGQFAQKWTGKFEQPAAQPAAAPAPATPAASNINPEILRGMTSPYTSDATKKVLGVLLQNQMSSDAVTQVDLGNKIGIMDKRGNIVRTIDKGEPNKGPEFGVISKDEFGNEQYGWRDPRTQTVTPVAKPQAAAPAGPAPAVPPAPPGVDPKAWRESFSKNAAINAQPAPFDETAKVRGEVTQLPSYKNIAQAAPIYRSMIDAAGRDSKASDLNLVYGLGKIFDPTSVVREGEMVMVKNTAGLPDFLVGAINALNGGAALSPETRKAIMAEAHGRMQSYATLYGQDAKHYRGIAERSRMNPLDVIPDFGAFDPWTPPAKPAPPPTVTAPAGPVTIDGYTIKAR